MSAGGFEDCGINNTTFIANLSCGCLRGRRIEKLLKENDLQRKCNEKILYTDEDAKPLTKNDSIIGDLNVVVIALCTDMKLYYSLSSVIVICNNIIVHI